MSPKGYLATNAIFQVKQSVLTATVQMNQSINHDMFVPAYGANYFCKRNQHQVFDGGGIFKRQDHFSVTTIFQSFFFIEKFQLFFKAEYIQILYIGQAMRLSKPTTNIRRPSLQQRRGLRLRVRLWVRLWEEERI